MKRMCILFGCLIVLMMGISGAALAEVFREDLQEERQQ